VLAAAGPALVYLYWGDVDGAGHLYGWRSLEWQTALRHVDGELGRLARRLGPDTLLVITADHGMVDVPHTNRLDLADHPELTDGIAAVGGEARFAQLYLNAPTTPGDVRRAADRFADAVGERGWVRTRDEAIAAGWFGSMVEERVRGRIGDVLIAATGSFAVIDSRTARPQVLRLIGQHGSLTPAEQQVPLLVQIG
jgi:predicted AlkP superfamily pyrophosphatase or phosphodiesterase